MYYFVYVKGRVKEFWKASNTWHKREDSYWTKDAAEARRFTKAEAETILREAHNDMPEFRRKYFSIERIPAKSFQLLIDFQEV